MRCAPARRPSFARFNPSLVLSSVALAALIGPSIAWSRPGDVDTTFGANGVLQAGVSSSLNPANAVVFQKDGKLLIAGNVNGNFAVARLNADGSPDTTFGTDGVAVGPPGSPASIVVQNDGSVVAGGNDPTGDLFQIVRYTSTGTIDAGFGTGGFTTTSFSNSGFASLGNILLQRDGKIVAVGGGYGGTFGPYIGVISRYDSNGTLDTSFAAGGKLVVTGPSFSQGALQDDEKIVAAGAGGCNYVACSFYAARFLSDGSFDSSFGPSPGGQTSIYTDGTAARAVAISPDGRILLGGGGYNYGTVRLARLTSTGALDGTFGTDGVVVSDIPGTVLQLRLTANNGIVALLSGSFVVARFYGNSGARDANFGDSGLVVPPPGLGQAGDLTLAETGDITVAGTSNYSATLVRYLNDYVPATSENTPMLPSVSCHTCPLEKACNACLARKAPCYFFCGVPTVNWFDPPLAMGYEYDMLTEDADFASLLSLPRSINGPLGVSANGVFLGTFGPGESVPLEPGTKTLRITGISPGLDPGASNAFPILLAFSSPAATFQMRPLTCPDSPTPGCTGQWGNSILSVNDHKPGHERLSVKFSNGPQINVDDFGNPLVPGDGGYSLCIYRDGGLAASLRIAAPDDDCDGKPCWSGSSDGFKFQDSSASYDGTRSLTLQAGSSGASAIVYKAKNAAAKAQTALPSGILESLLGGTTITVQFVGDTEGHCFSSTLASSEQPKPWILVAK